MYHYMPSGAESFAQQDFDRAIRGRNTNSPNTINYLPRRTSSPSALLPDSVVVYPAPPRPYLDLFSNLYIRYPGSVWPACVNIDTSIRWHTTILAVGVLLSIYIYINGRPYTCNPRIYPDLNLFSPYTDITGKRKVDLRLSSSSLLPALPFLFEEFDISLGSAVVGVSAVGGACGCDRSTAATEESIRGGSCRTG